MVAENAVRVVTKVKSVLCAFGAAAVLLAATPWATGQFLLDHVEIKGAVAPESNDPDNFQAPGIPLWPTLDEQVLTLAFSRDGTKLVTGGARHLQPGQIKSWDVASGKLLTAVKGVAGVRGLAYAPHEESFATGDFSGTVTLRDATTGKEIASAKGHTIGVNAVAYSADGAHLASAGLDKLVKIWHVKGLAQEKVLAGHSDMVFSVAYFKHGKAIVSGGRDKTARIWDLESGKEKFTLEHAQAVEAVAIAPDDTMVATACWDGIVRLWHAETSKEAGVFEGNDASVNSLAFSPKGEWLAGAGADGVVRIWDARTFKLLTRLERHIGAIWSVAFTGDGKLLASGSSDKTAKLWNVAERKEVATFNTGEQQPLAALAVALDGTTAAFAKGNSIELRNPKTGQLQLAWVAHVDMVTSVVFTPDGQSLATSSTDKTIKIWDRGTGKERKTLAGLATSVHALAFGTDGNKLASAGDDGMIRWWDTESGMEIEAFPAHLAPIRALALSRDGQNLASGATDGSLLLWDLEQQTAITLLEGHRGGIRALAFAADGTLASGGDDGIVRIWEHGQTKERVAMQGTSGPVWALAFNPGGRALISAGKDRIIHVWDAVAGRPRGTLLGHEFGTTALALAPDGSYLLSGGRDAKAIRWDAVVTSLPPVTLVGDSKAVWFARYSPAGDLLASGGNGGTVTLWTRALTPARVPFRTRGGVYWDGAFAPNGQTFAVAASNAVLLIDALTGQTKRRIPFSQPVCTVAYSPDGKYLAAGTGNWQNPDAVPECRILNAETGAVVAILSGHKMRLFRVDFSPDGKTLASTSRDKTVRLWEAPSGKLKQTLTHNEPARGMVFLADGNVATASFDAHLRIWDVATGQIKKEWNTAMALGSLAVSPDGTLLAAAENPADSKESAPLKLWEVATGKELLSLQGHSSRVLGLAFTRDGRGLVAAGGTLNAYGEINYWDLTSGRLESTLKTPQQWMENCAVSWDGKRVFSAGVTGMHLWHLDFTKQERTWHAHDNLISCGLFLDGGRALATASMDSTINIWDVRKPGAPLATLLGHKGNIRALAVLPDGKTLVSGGADKTIKLWDWAAGKEIATLQGSSSIVYTLAISPDGKTLASGGGDHRKPQPGELILWDLETRKPRQTIASVERAIFSLAYSPDGTLLAGSVSASALKVWDAKTGELRQSFTTAHVRPVAFSPDGKFLVAAGGKTPSKTGVRIGHVRIWDTTTWEERPAVLRHDEVVFDVSVSPDSTAVASAGQDGFINLWPVAGAAAMGGKAPAIVAVPEAPRKIGVNQLVGKGDPALPVAPHAEPVARSLSWKVWMALAMTLIVAVAATLGLWRGRRLDEDFDVPVLPDSRIQDQRRLLIASAKVQDLRRTDCQSVPQRASLLQWFLHPVRVASMLFGCAALLAIWLVVSEFSNSANTPKSDIPAPVEQPGLLRRLKGHTGPVQALRFTPNGQRLVSVSGWPGRDRSLRVWDVATGEELQRLATPGQAGSLALTRDGRFAIVGSSVDGGGGAVLHIDLETNTVLKRLRGHTAGGLGCVVFSTDERFAYSVSQDGTVRRWDLAEGKEVGKFRVNGKWARRVAELPDGRVLTAGSDGLLQFWNVETLEEVHRIDAGKVWLSSMTVVPGGKQALIGTWDISAWDLVTGRKVRVLQTHHGEVRETMLSPDGLQLLSASYDGTIRLWDFATGEMLRIVGTHNEWVNTAVFSPDGKIVATGGGGGKEGDKYLAGVDHDIRLWDIAPRSEESDSSVIGHTMFWLGGAALIVGAVVIPVFVTRVIRRRKRDLEVRADETAAATAPPADLLSFACSGCGKRLKIKAALAGKRIRCPKCGQIGAATA